jgi:hypothetical protein
MLDASHTLTFGRGKTIYRQKSREGYFLNTVHVGRATLAKWTVTILHASPTSRKVLTCYIVLINLMS